MMFVEDGAGEIFDKALEKYEKHFGKIFPHYEYHDITSTDGYTVSIKGAKRLAEFIDKRIKDNDPVEIPEGYEDRLY
jgi:hypothetical protein